ncbi:MAG TPA: UDP-glucose 4-epimerase GalE [Mycobacteriales bacterium]|nr:UDP-glucose 4-epimerase GalE [Mycobacteriales bacterium]
MKVVVTGGAGYIGSVVARQLLARGDEVLVVDDLSTGHADAVPDGAALLQTNVRELLAADLAGADAVLHFAARSLVGESVVDPGKYWDGNVGATLALLATMRAAGVPRLVFSSTAATYGQPDTVPILESAPARPINPYGASKLAIDHMLMGWCSAHGLGAASLRYFNVAGAWGGAGERHDPETHLIPNALAVPAGRRDAVEVFGDDYPTPDGTCVRDYIHVGDLGEAHLLALEAVRPGEHEVFNLGSGRGYSVLEVVQAVRDVTGHPVPIRWAPRRAGDPPSLVASNERIHAALGWAPRRDLTTMVRDAWQAIPRDPG